MPFTWRSSTYVPLPVRRRGSSVRLTLAPTFLGRVWRSSMAVSAAAWPRASVIGFRSLAQGHPLLSVVAAKNGGAAPLQAPDLIQRLEQDFCVPGIARSDVSVESRAQAHRIGCQQELATPIEGDERAGRSGRMSRQRN